jgi:DNA-binding Lrp family transcriptional regulator
VFVEILLDRTVHDVMDTFKAAVQVRPEILEAHLVAGGFDYLLKTRVADMAPTASSSAASSGRCPACARRAPMR